MGSPTGHDPRGDGILNNHREATYRKDLFYVNFIAVSDYAYCRREIVVSRLVWLFYRLQYWRFRKMKNFNVLKEIDGYYVTREKDTLC
jgi:hypothetical protein